VTSDDFTACIVSHLHIICRSKFFFCRDFRRKKKLAITIFRATTYIVCTRHELKVCARQRFMYIDFITKLSTDQKCSQTRLDGHLPNLKVGPGSHLNGVCDQTGNIKSVNSFFFSVDRVDLDFIFVR